MLTFPARSPTHILVPDTSQQRELAGEDNAQTKLIKITSYIVQLMY